MLDKYQLMQNPLTNSKLSGKKLHFIESFTPAYTSNHAFSIIIKPVFEIAILWNFDNPVCTKI